MNLQKDQTLTLWLLYCTDEDKHVLGHVFTNKTQAEAGLRELKADQPHVWYYLREFQTEPHQI